MECPVVMDTLAGTADISVSVFDRSNSDNVSCTVFGFDSVGTVIFAQPMGSTTGAATASRTLLVNTPTLTSAVVECSIPAPDAGGPSGGQSGVHSMTSHAS